MPSKPKKIPMRMCVGCHEMKPKKELLRVVKPAEGDCAIDRTGKASGRGAYICPSAECLKKAQKTKALERGLEAAISPEVYATLAEQIAQAAQEGA